MEWTKSSAGPFKPLANSVQNDVTQSDNRNNNERVGPKFDSPLEV